MAKGLPFLSVAAFEVSDDDNQLLYSTDETGFRQYKLFVKDLKTGAVQGPLAERVTSATWAADNRTLFYVTEHPVTKRPDTLWRLALGGQPVKVREETDELFSIGVGRTKDKKFVVLGSGSTDTWDRWLLPAATPGGELRPVLPREKGHKYDVEHRDGTLFIRTNKDAKNFRLVTAPLADPSPARWKPFVEHRPDVLLEDVEVFKDFVVLQEKQAGLNHIRVHGFSDGRWKEVAFPEPVYTAFASGTPEFDSKRLRYGYQSLTTPSSVYDYDMEAGTSVLLKRDEVLGGFDPQRYVSERLWATARDGVKVPISIVYPKGFARDGKAPLWLYAYGSYGAGMSATFDSRRLSLLDRGIPFAIAHIRGGNEMGEAWHDDGMLMKKKNTFFDFIDCAQFLVKEKWTAPDRLLIEGGSAGGLLMGAVTNERPDLFRAVHAAVPFTDVINTMMDASLPLTVGEYLEWGNPNEKAAFDYMLSYSPYDNLAKKAYPALLVTTSYNDSQVMYWEPAKYVAKLRTLKTDTQPARPQDEDAAGRPRRRERPLRRAQGPRLRGRLDAEAGGDHEVGPAPAVRAGRARVKARSAGARRGRRCCRRGLRTRPYPPGEREDLVGRQPRRRTPGRFGAPVEPLATAVSAVRPRRRALLSRGRERETGEAMIMTRAGARASLRHRRSSPGRIVAASPRRRR